MKDLEVFVFYTLSENVTPPHPAPQDHGYNVPPALPNLLKTILSFTLLRICRIPDVAPEVKHNT
jgi:hypothetical protein